MDEITLETLFLRFRDEGDLAALEAVFDRTAPELLALAARLTSDVTDADDLVQATFVAALTSRHRFDAKQRLVPWLVGILTKLAAKSRRSARRRIDPARIEAEPIVDPTHRIVDTEQKNALLAALDSLPMLYREVMQRVLDGKKPIDIANELRRPPGTVRMQLQRGLHLLRSSLPPSLATALVLALPSRGEGAIKERVLEYAKGLTRTKTAAGALAPLLAGGGLMSLKFGLVAALLAALGYSYLSHDGGGRPGVAPSSAPTSARSPTVESVRDDRSTVSAPTSDPVRRMEAASKDASREPAAAATLRLFGRVKGLENHHPESATLEVSLRGSSPLRVPVHPDGSYECDLAPLLAEGAIAGERETKTAGPGRITTEQASEPHSATSDDLAILVRHEFVEPRVHRHPFADVRPSLRDANAPREVRRDIDVSLASVIQGEVKRDDGETGETMVGIFDASSFAGKVIEPRFTATTDANGRFVVASEIEGDVEVVTYHQGLQPAVAKGRARLGETLDVGILRPSRGGVAIAGRVRFPSPLRSDECRIHARREAKRDAGEKLVTFGGMTHGADGWHVASGSAQSDSAGEFSIDGLEPGEYQLSLPLTGDDSFLMKPKEPIRVTAPHSDVVLGENVQSIRILVTKNGAPDTGAKIEIETARDRTGFSSRDGGELRFLAYSDVDVTATVTRPGSTPIVLKIPAASRVFESTYHADFATRAADAALELVAPQANQDFDGVVAITISPSRTGESAASPIIVTRRFTSGHLLLRDLEPGKVHVHVEPGAEGREPAAMFGPVIAEEDFDVDLASQQTTQIQLRMPQVARLTISTEGMPLRPLDGDLIEVEVTNAQGERVDREFSAWVKPGYVRSRRLEPGTTNYMIPNVPPGTYTITSRSHEHPLAPLTVTLAAGKTTNAVLRP